MNKKINYRFVSLYYRDIYHFTSEVIQFVKEFKQFNSTNSYYSNDKKFLEMETDELNLIHVIPEFVKTVHFDYSLNDKIESKDLIIEIEKDIKTYLEMSPYILDETLVISFSEEFESLPKELNPDYDNYELIYQFNSNYHLSVNSMLEKVKRCAKKYFDNPNEYLQLQSCVFQTQKANKITVGEIVNPFESPVEFAFDFKDYPDEKTMCETIENTLTKMNLINKSKELTLVILLVYNFGI